MSSAPYVYMLASHRHGTLYVGVTARLLQRMQEHRAELMPGFTRDHGVKRLVWFEPHWTIEAAIVREKRIKRWNRAWKIALIEAGNPNWDDLAPRVLGLEPLLGCEIAGGLVTLDPRFRGDDLNG